MTLRAGLRLLLLLAMLFAPVGRIGMAQAMPGHCAGMTAATSTPHARPHHAPAPQPDDQRAAVDCMIACTAMAPAPAPALAPPPVAIALTGVSTPSNLTGIRPEAATPPPRPA